MRPSRCGAETAFSSLVPHFLSSLIPAEGCVSGAGAGGRGGLRLVIAPWALLLLHANIST